MTELNDPILNTIVRDLIKKHRCHTVVLYGSRARGLSTSTSDYDVFGVLRQGKMLRIAKQQKGFFWDVFVFPEKDLKQLGKSHFSWKGARILYAKGSYGQKLLRRLETLLKSPFKKHPRYEIEVLKVWAQKELDRCRVEDTQGLFRRAEFQAALVKHYFMVRQKRFLGPKEGFAWIKQNDPTAFKLIHRALKSPTNLSALKAAASRVYKVSLK